MPTTPLKISAPRPSIGGRGISPTLLKKMRELPDKPATVAEAVESMSRSGVKGESSGVATIRANFAFQSFFSSTLIEQALLAQNIAEPIVRSTIVEEPTAGYGIALYPSSETPVAVQILMSGGKSGGPAVIMKPGDAYVSQQRFDGIRYGLPSGWLGGGAAQIRILQERDDILFLPAAPELVFHRIRLPIWAVTGNPAAAGRGVSPNWPRRFPWPNATDLNGNPQQGQPSIGITPTKTMFRLRLATLGAAARMRFLLVKTDDLDLGSNGATLDAINTSGSWVDLSWPQTAASGFQIGGTVTAEFPTIVGINDETSRTGGDSAIALLIDMDGGLGGTGSLATATKVDIIRYGTL